MGLYGHFFEDAKEVTDEDRRKNQRLVPIFVVNTYTSSSFGKILRNGAGMKYSHGLISFSPTLTPMYSFDDSYDEKDEKTGKITEYRGLTIDNFKRYKEKMGDGDLRVICILVTPEILKKVKQSVQYYIDHIKDTSYGDMKLLKIIVGNKKLSSFGDMSMFCSEFVDTMLKRAKIDISGKSSANTSPDDLGTFHDKNNFFQVYEGKIKGYDPEKIKAQIETLKNETKYKDLQSQKKGHMKDAYDHEIGAKNHLPQYLGHAAKAGAGALKKKVLGEDGHFYYTEDVEGLSE